MPKKCFGVKHSMFKTEKNLETKNCCNKRMNFDFPENFNNADCLEMIYTGVFESQERGFDNNLIIICQG